MSLKKLEKIDGPCPQGVNPIDWHCAKFQERLAEGDKFFYRALVALLIIVLSLYFYEQSL